jgi:acyl-coenzyme A synthetase/AMP-(fatty) acid ligase/acyl carrier protein
MSRTLHERWEEPFEATAVEGSINERFARQVAAHGDRLAVGTGAYHWTYRELDGYAEGFAAAIGAGSEMEPPVALLMAHDAPLIAGLLGVLRSGRSYVVLDPHDAPARREAIVRGAGSTVIVTDELHEQEARRLAGETRRLVRAAEAQGRRGEGPAQSVAVAADQAAAVTFTSGTTGRPKGVVQSHRMLLHHCRNYAHVAGLGPEDRLSLVSACSVAASMSSLWGALLNGGALFPFDVRGLGIGAMRSWLEEERLTVLHCVPSLWRALGRQEGEALDSLRLVRLGGEAVLPGDVEILRKMTGAHCGLLVALSSTETGAVAMHLVDREKAAEGRIPVGTPLVGMQIELVGEGGGEGEIAVTSGEAGRLRVRSRYLASGYLEEGALQAFARDGEGLAVFQTADLVRRNERGLLEHLGRVDAVIKVRGQRIDPAEVEGALGMLGMFREVAVGAAETGGTCAAGGEGKPGEAVLAAWVVPEKGGGGGGIDVAMVRGRLRELLPEYMVPSQLVVMEALPRTGSGKVDRRRLPAPRAGGAAARGGGKGGGGGMRGGGPRDSLERQLALIVRQALGIDADEGVGRGDDFFLELGGTSLQAAEVITQIEHRMGIRLPLSELVRLPTIEALAEHLHRTVVVPAATPLVLLKEGAESRPLFVFHRGSGGLYCYQHLVRHLADRQRVYGLQMPGLQGEQWPLSTMRGLAALYVRHMREVQGSGPYLLAGTCLGGLVALEVAQQLRAAGERVNLLMMINTLPPLTGGPLRVRGQRSLAPVKFALRAAAWRMVWGADHLLGKRLGLTGGPRFRQFAGRAVSRARRSYRPRAYDGRLEYVVGKEFADVQERARMERLMATAREVRLHRFDGVGNDLIIPPAVGTTAELLQRLIDEGA